MEIIKQSFAARGVATENIWAKVDTKVPAILINIFWQQYSFTMRCNFKPQALYRENEKPFSTGRIMAIKGNYFELIKNTKDTSEEMSVLLENEIASLYVPDDKMRGAILKAKHRAANNEFVLNQTDAGREFVLLVAEAVCGTNVYHEEGSRKSFNI